MSRAATQRWGVADLLAALQGRKSWLLNSGRDEMWWIAREISALQLAIDEMSARYPTEVARANQLIEIESQRAAERAARKAEVPR